MSLRTSPAGSAIHDKKRIEVAAAVLHDDTGRFLLAQRPPGKAYEGYWEFPGGKVEHGESAADAMRRELHEELGIEVDAGSVCPWLTRDFDYEHANVRLRFFRIYRWRGNPHGREGQQFAWQESTALNVAPILPANGPILRALSLPTVYGITHATETGVDVFIEQLQRALVRGLKLIQIREKEMPDDALRIFSRRVIEHAHQQGARVLINGDARLAAELGADGVHLTAALTAALSERPACEWVAASCHNAGELANAIKLGVDFAVMGAVQPTLSHPGAGALGWDGFAQATRNTSIPVYALGGMRQDDLELARLSGAHGVAMLRGAWR